MKVFRLFLVIQFYVYNCQSTEAKGPTSGPYKLSMYSAVPCEKPPKPIDKNPPILYFCGLYANGLMTTNFTVLREHRNLKIKNKCYMWENGKWKIIFVMNVGCNGMFLPIMSQAVGVKYDNKKCCFLPGNYFYDNIDPNQVQHQWASSLEYGKTKWRVEMFSQAGNTLCWEYVVVIAPEPK